MESADSKDIVHNGERLCVPMFKSMKNQGQDIAHNERTFAFLSDLKTFK